MFQIPAKSLKIAQELPQDIVLNGWVNSGVRSIFKCNMNPSEVPPPVDKTTGTLIQTTFNHKKFHNKQVKQNMTNKPKKERRYITCLHLSSPQIRRKFICLGNHQLPLFTISKNSLKKWDFDLDLGLATTTLKILREYFV
jgi:hypothetical protein